jgi:alkylation response protein AidB-like acyl-CoA dehydrogenase
MIDLLPNIEQQQIADSIGTFLADTLPVERLRSVQAQSSSQEHDLWPDLAALGCFGLSIPESCGGSGLSLVEEIMAFREYGRHLISPALLATVLATQISDAAGNEALTADIVAGKRAAALLIPLGGAVVDRISTGAFQVVGDRQDDLLVVWNDDGAALFESHAAASKRPLVGLDPTVRFGEFTLRNAPPLAYIPTAQRPIPQTAMVLLGAMLTGMTEAVRDIAADYAKTREQFGHPIGVFQAIKHRCADIALSAEAAWAQTAWAALIVQSGAQDAAFQSINAKMIAADGALEAARRTIQIFGGMGFTAEVNVHLFLKRAHLLEQLGGSSQSLQEQLVDLPLGL